MNEEQMEQLHVVLDLETMGIRHDAAIIEIGLVIFNHMSGQRGTPNLIEDWSSAVKLESSMQHGGTVSPETITWWMHSDRTEARDTLTCEPPISLPKALNEIAYTLGKYSSVSPLPLIWGNGVNFDNAILKSAYERLGVKVPWSYKQDMDFRTLKMMFKDKVPEPAFIGTPHIALDDARHEALWLSKILRYTCSRDPVSAYDKVPQAIIDVLNKD